MWFPVYKRNRKLEAVFFPRGERGETKGGSGEENKKGGEREGGKKMEGEDFQRPQQKHEAPRFSPVFTALVS